MEAYLDVLSDWRTYIPVVVYPIVTGCVFGWSECADVIRGLFKRGTHWKREN